MNIAPYLLILCVAVGGALPGANMANELFQQITAPADAWLASPQSLSIESGARTLTLRNQGSVPVMVRFSDSGSATHMLSPKGETGDVRFLSYQLTQAKTEIDLNGVGGTAVVWVEASNERQKTLSMPSSAASVALATTAPQPPGVAAVGTGANAARNDHVHALPTLTNGTVAIYLGLGKPDAESDTAVHAAHNASGANSFPGPITDPDVPRVVKCVATAGYDGGDVTVTGTDAFDATLVETISPSGGVTIEGVKGFKTVTGIEKTTVGVTGSVSIGTGVRFGVGRSIQDTLAFGVVDSVWEAIRV